MTYSNPYAAYSRANETKSHAEQIFLLYCGAISFVQQAKEAHQENDHDKRYRLIDRTMQIIRGLRACLDYEANQKVATALNDYYKDIDTLLVAIQCEDNKEEICDKVIENLRTIKETWAEINPDIKSVLEPERYLPLNGGEAQASYKPNDFSV
ncbi:MAG: flagellar export chaperone FliS [Rickettsiales bacterium]|nr:flagellar export chaperone FliS [Pseudomonadota bacterium]MDA0967591.1 flagellar export chaperone FliS [Pseudomonadota bacterium]MDG4544380.1 flagellar export chaperone FliS [Rickettsiales bacterium]MDG4546510.1 flagellar export chaperone FliS [Rickettsiales bacterium]MDG4548654.1 flagellar export chaperone FliS [Rickettsiales bacterium]